jgi:hypothetical protein
MLIKSADDKSKRLALLESLQASPKLDARQKAWARDELVRLRRGIQGERDAAHYLDNYLVESRNYALIHDLRLVFNDEAAQIDHLLISRTFEFYLLETKNFGGNLRINEHGEFSVRYPGEREFGVPSPLEQSRRHERVLLKALESLGITGRVTTRPTFHHIVLVHPKATITRPSSRILDTSVVIKADQFRTWHERHVDRDPGIASALAGMLNVRSGETVQSWGQGLARLHRPPDPLAMPEFMSPKTESEPARARRPAPQTPTAKPASSADRGEPSEGRKLICASCGCKISFAEGKYCWNNEARFGGLQYCREHQAAFR